MHQGHFRSLWIQTHSRMHGDQIAVLQRALDLQNLAGVLRCILFHCRRERVCVATEVGIVMPELLPDEHVEGTSYIPRRRQSKKRNRGVVYGALGAYRRRISCGHEVALARGSSASARCAPPTGVRAPDCARGRIPYCLLRTTPCAPAPSRGMPRPRPPERTMAFTPVSLSWPGKRAV